MAKIEETMIWIALKRLLLEEEKHFLVNKLLKMPTYKENLF